MDQLLQRMKFCPVCGHALKVPKDARDEAKECTGHGVFLIQEGIIYERTIIFTPSD